MFKGIDGVLELAGGLALFLTSEPTIRRIVGFLTRAELAEDPRDFIASHAVHLAQDLSVGARHFAGLYLLAHGAVKLGLVTGLLRGSRGAYPIAVLLLTAFIGYQIYHLSHTPSLLLLGLTGIDTVIVMLIWREWRRTLEHDNRR
ncbi:MAG: DUF2127 domain-containing protein [Rudaea sp.]